MDDRNELWLNFLNTGKIADYIKFYEATETAEENPDEEDVNNAHKNERHSDP